MCLVMTGSLAYLGAATHQPLSASSMPVAGNCPFTSRFSLDRQKVPPTMTDRITLGKLMHAMVERLYPLCRSITSNIWRAPADEAR